MQLGLLFPERALGAGAAWSDTGAFGARPFKEDEMPRCIGLAALAAGAAMALWTAPAAATQPVFRPGDAGTAVTRAADTKATPASTERKRRPALVRRVGVDEYWHDRLGAGRWLHYQQVNAGYPARPGGYAGVHRVYIPGTMCCGHPKPWAWMGRKHGHGARHWVWIGLHHHYRHHHH
jgi:hypothetical protein